MTIILSDIPAAVNTYLDTKVSVTLSTIVADSGTLNPNEEGNFTVTVSNADASNGGVRVRDIVLHLTSSAPSKLKLKVPAGAAVAPRATIDENDPQLARNSYVNEMFLWYYGNEELDAGEDFDLPLEVKAFDEGSASITAHVHAAVDLDALFPGGEHGATANRPVTVI